MNNNFTTADIGADNSRFGHFQVDSRGPVQLVKTTRLPTRKAASGGEAHELHFLTTSRGERA
jgi:hypothetical protein